MPWLESLSDGIRLRVRVQPRATRTEIAGLHDGALKIRLAAPPVDGAANDSLVRFVAATLRVPRAAVSLVSGRASRSKTLHISGIGAAAAAQRLGICSTGETPLVSG